MVDMLIQQEQGDQAFSSLWILVASWKDVEFTDQPSIVRIACRKLAARLLEMI